VTTSHEGIARRVNAERLAVLGWGRAILLQLSHPLIAAAVADHSAVGGCPATVAARLRGTVRAMLALTFGDEQDAARTIETIRGIHRRVNGQLRETVGPYPAGTRYSAEDPALLLWVHATLTESIVLVYDDLVSPLDEAARDAYCEQAVTTVLALGAREVDVPRTWAALMTWLDATRRSGAIAVGPDARHVAGIVLSPPMASVVWPVAWGSRLLTVGMLPEDVRAQYGFSWTPRHARQFDRTRRVLRGARRRTPRAIAWWAAARQASAAGPRDVTTPIVPRTPARSSTR
jgi:uncharacterized protein (DUF2236 family)